VNNNKEHQDDEEYQQVGLYCCLTPRTTRTNTRRAARLNKSI